MSAAFAALTSDPNLLACELVRPDAAVRLTEEGRRHNAIGMGWYSADDVLLQRYAPPSAPRDLSELAFAGTTEALVFHARVLPLGMSLEDNAQPFRFRSWLFAHAGELSAYRGFKQRLWEELPDFLKRSVRGETDSEVAFAVFLQQLREAGRLDDRALEPERAAQLLGVTARRLEELASARGAAGKSSIDLVTTNQHLLLATRLGPSPLYFRQLGGRAECERCGLARRTPRTERRIRAHERCRSVIVASHPRSPEGWREIPEATVLAVAPSAEVQLLAI